MQLRGPRGVSWRLCDDRRKPIRCCRPMGAGQRSKFRYRPPAHSDPEALPTFGAPKHVAYLVTELALWNRDRHESSVAALLHQCAGLLCLAAKRISIALTTGAINKRFAHHVQRSDRAVIQRRSLSSRHIEIVESRA
jgi:hypothetical protein